MAITPTPMIIHLDDRIFFFFWLTFFFFFFLSSFIFSSLRLFLFPPRVFVYSNNFCICLFEIRSPSSFFVYFPFSPPSIFVCRYNPRLCSSFFALLFFLFLPLALSPFPRLTSGQNRCFEPWTFFSPALLAQLYMPLILFKLQSFPLSFFSISLYTISLTESTPFSFSITSRLGSRFAYISPICSPKFPNSWCPTVQTIRVARQRGPLFLSHSFTHSLIITRIYRPERESLPFAQIFVLSIFVSPPPPLLIPLSLPPRVRAFCIAAGALSASLGCSKVNLY